MVKDEKVEDENDVEIVDNDISEQEEDSVCVLSRRLAGIMFKNMGKAGKKTVDKAGRTFK